MEGTWEDGRDGVLLCTSGSRQGGMIHSQRFNQSWAAPSCQDGNVLCSSNCTVGFMTRFGWISTLRYKLSQASYPVMFTLYNSLNIHMIVEQVKVKGCKNITKNSTCIFRCRSNRRRCWLILPVFFTIPIGRTTWRYKSIHWFCPRCLIRKIKICKLHCIV